MKTLLTRTIPLLLCIAVGTALSWLSIYAFYFAARAFHSVAMVRACDAAGGFLLTPSRYFFRWMGQDQSAIFFSPTSFSGTNGLILGMLFYGVFRWFWNRREERKTVRLAPAARPAEARVG